MASPRGYRRLLKWAALPVTDRRWAAPLSAVALGFGLFVGVAIGPGAAGTFATGAAQIIEIPGFSGGVDSGDGGSSSPSAAVDEGGGGESSVPAAETALPPFASAEGEAEPAEATTPPATHEPPVAAEEPDPEEEALAGIVLHANPAAASYTIVEPAGTLDVVHAAKPPPAGAKVGVPVRLLANGTFAEAGKWTKSGLRTRATLSGTVTYVDSTATAPAYTVSKRGVSVLVHVHPDPTGAAPTLPALGAFASVAVEIEKLAPAPPPAGASASGAPSSPIPVAEPVPPADPEETVPPPAPPAEPVPAPAPPVPTPAPVPAGPSCPPNPALPPPAQPSAILWQRQVKTQGKPFTYGDFAGIVEALCPDSGQLLLSADDIRESGHELSFAVPATIETAKLEVGQSILATATIAADGALALTGLASDERTKGAEDAKSIQGDLVSSKPSDTGRRPRRPRP